MQGGQVSELPNSSNINLFSAFARAISAAKFTGTVLAAVATTWFVSPAELKLHQTQTVTEIKIRERI